VSGDVFDSRTGAIAFASVNLWVDTGRFLMCNLPGSAWLTISEPGFQLVSRPAADLSASVFELELKRNP
jgi:hypothetical protein